MIYYICRLWEVFLARKWNLSHQSPIFLILSPTPIHYNGGYSQSYCSNKRHIGRQNNRKLLGNLYFNIFQLVKRMSVNFIRTSNSWTLVHLVHFRDTWAMRDMYPELAKFGPITKSDHFSWLTIYLSRLPLNWYFYLFKNYKFLYNDDDWR